MNSVATLLVLLAVIAVSTAFAPQGARVTSSSTSLGMFGKKPAPKQDENAWLDGRGKKITVREDEDNAMWVEEPADKKKKGGKAPPKKKGGFFNF